VLATLEDPWLIRKILEHLVAQYVLWALMNNAAQVTVEEGLAGTPAVDDVIGSHRPEWASRPRAPATNWHQGGGSPTNVLPSAGGGQPLHPIYRSPAGRCGRHDALCRDFPRAWASCASSRPGSRHSRGSPLRPLVLHVTAQRHDYESNYEPMARMARDWGASGVGGARGSGDERREV
jgi:hypothetical protein